MSAAPSGERPMVSESSYEYLLSELMALGKPSSTTASATGGSSSSSLGGGSTKGVGSTTGPGGEQSPVDVEMVQRLEAMGYDVGYRYVERAVANQYLIGTEPLDVVKYICKEFWEEIFRKKIDKLQTNHKGVFVLSDFKFKWLERYSLSDDMTSKQAAAKLLHFPCGILRGALANLGITAVVNADFNTLPAVTFNVRSIRILSAGVDPKL